ncbi:MAG: methylmalonyl-CoA carboxyltransferase [Anaerolineaceae bacterium]|nr:methylmalonyl-CoA carboxyltransferase [Anaerolineaceae bacterium]
MDSDLKNFQNESDRSARLNDRLLEKRAHAAEGGGAKRVAVQHAKGKLTARERIELLLDEGSFQELDRFVSHRHTDFDLDKKKFDGDGIITGFGKIDGRPICVFSQDFTVMGGSFGEGAGQKLIKLMDAAMKAGVPVIGMNDGGGARIQEGVFSLAAFGEVFYRNTIASGVIPQISLILGPCAGGAVYSPALTDFVIMSQSTANMFITGPQVVQAVTGEEVDLETLGGARAHTVRSGVSHFSAENDQASIALTRKLLSYLPLNNREEAPAVMPTDDPWRMEEELNTIIPSNPSEPYDIKEVISMIVDQGSFFEVHTAYAPNAVVGFSRLHGQSIGVVANQPNYLAGVLDIDASDKIARFVRFCDAFNIPLLTFCDTPGFMPGVAQEHGGIIRHGAKIIYAYAEATVPKLTVITRKGYGGAYIVMSSRHLHADMVFAYPGAEIAVMGADGAVNILHRREMKDAHDPEVKRKKLIEDYREKFSNPYRAAEAGYVDDVLLPAETRPRLIAALELLRDKSEKLPAKKHGSIPM